MNKRVLTLSVILPAIFFTFSFCNSKKQPEQKVEEVKPAPLSMNENSGSFNESFTRLLTSYYSLTDALVEADTSKANAASLQLAANADSLNTSEIQGDT